MNRIKLFITDDHALFRAGVKKAFEAEPDIEIIGEADSLSRLMESRLLGEAEVLLLDISLGKDSGLEALPKLSSDFPALKILILSMHNKPVFIKRAINGGAFGYLLKQSPPQRLIEAVKSAAEGRKYLDPDLSDIICTFIGSGTAENGPEVLYDSLSFREQQIFRLIAEGETPARIAKTLFISKKTVENHRSRILSKLKLESTAELFILAEKLGVV